MFLNCLNKFKLQKYSNFAKNGAVLKNNINNNNTFLIKNLYNQIRCASGVVQSPLGNVKISNDNLIEYVWKNNENYIEKPASVSNTFYFIFII